MRNAVLLAILIVLTNTAPTFAIDPSYDPMHVPTLYIGGLDAYGKSGVGLVTGQLWANTKKFGKVVYPNADVYLIPDTDFTYYFIENMAYIMEHPNAKRALDGYPKEIAPYTHTTTTDSNGNFTFRNLPDGVYYVNAYVQYEEDSHPTRTRTTIGTAPDGETVYGTERHEGFKINSDDVVIYASVPVDSAHGNGQKLITSFSVMGELLCCKGSL